MRRSKEIIVLLVLLAGMMGFVLWYVIDRRARNRLPGNLAEHGVSRTNTGPAGAGNGGPVNLAEHDGKTIDFSSGQPVVKDSTADRAALEQAAQEMAAAVKGVTFGPPAKKPSPENPAARSDTGTITGPAAAGNSVPPPEPAGPKKD